MTPEQAKKRYINRWKREHSRKTNYGNRLLRAYNVPGTVESGQLAMLLITKPQNFLGGKSK